jgi:hypothetical protein
MRNAFIVAGIVAMTSLSSAQQATTQYVISTHILAGNSLQASAVETLASPTFRVPAGRPATMNLGDATDGLRLAITPSDLGSGKVGLRVVAETRHGERIQASTFDLLTGTDASTPTVALRDGTGAFMLDKQGRPLFMEFQTSVRR